MQQTDTVDPMASFNKGQSNSRGGLFSPDFESRLSDVLETRTNNARNAPTRKHSTATMVTVVCLTGTVCGLLGAVLGAIIPSVTRWV